MVGAPVDDPVVPVDPAALVEMDEPAHDGADVALVHREADPPVVHRRAHPPELVDDVAAVLVQPLPHARDERFASELFPARALAQEERLDRVLRRDAGVVVPGLHEDVEPLHPLPAREHVAERDLQRVSEVEVARDVRRREAVDPALAARVGVGRVVAFLLPRLLPAVLDALRLIQRFHRADVVRQRLCLRP